MFPCFKLRVTRELGRGIKVFVRLDGGITRGEVWDPQQQRINAQARQLEQMRKKLSEKDQQEALWEGGKDLAAWEAGKDHEVSFWERYLVTEGLYWPEDYKFRLDLEQPLQSYVVRFLNAPPGTTVSILDVGAGPLTRLGKRWQGHTVHITAVDPLADKYKRLLAEVGITPPVQTQPGEVERLSELFSANRFDLVHMRNALDHSYDPLLGIQQMLDVVKPKGYVVLRHVANEGENEDYRGFHQWNFCADNGRFVIWNRNTRLSVNDALDGLAQITVEEIQGEILVGLRKGSG
jgi:SAM-dependent methyltransferase